MEYNRATHSRDRRAAGGALPSRPRRRSTEPDRRGLRLAFRVEETRTQRRSDGTVSIEGVRFEVPSRYRHLERLSVRYASWDLGRVHLVDARRGHAARAAVSARPHQERRRHAPRARAGRGRGGGDHDHDHDREERGDGAAASPAHRRVRPRRPAAGVPAQSDDRRRRPEND